MQPEWELLLQVSDDWSAFAAVSAALLEQILTREFPETTPRLLYWFVASKRKLIKLKFWPFTKPKVSISMTRYVEEILS